MTRTANTVSTVRFLCLLLVFAAIVPVIGCNKPESQTDAPAAPSAPNAAKPTIAPSLPPEVQVGPPK